MNIKKHILVFLFFLLSNFCVTAGVYHTVTDKNNTASFISPALKTEDILSENREIQCPTVSELKVSEQVRLYLPEKDEINIIDLEDYVVGVMTAEMYGDAPVEALKAMSVAARTYTLYMCEINKNKGYDVVADHSISQGYIDENGAMEAWNSSGHEKYEIMKNAVELTKGEVLCYDGKLICALYHASSYPTTESCENIFVEKLPYLTGTSSYEAIENAYRSQVEYSIDELNNTLGKHGYPDVRAESLEIFNIKNENGRCDYLFIKDSDVAFSISGRVVRNVFSIMSTSFEVAVDGGSVVFDVYGYGHGVGLSQNGAVQLAKKGESYHKILSKFIINEYI